jgi:FMN phosphatase YigB (HAD superfamily)|tara:strand:+ start:4440 stop:4970 length:531 start_codon:yes stop_codon:yes gene_type:complete
MKLLFENWRKYLNEQEEKKVVTFDFDDTLAKSDFNDETGTWKHAGPYEPMMKRIKEFIREPDVVVYVVTSRYEDREAQSLENEEQRAVQEFLDEHGLNVDGVYFTNGNAKIETLKNLNSSMHHDDDPEDILDAEEAGLEAIPSDPYGIFGKLRNAYEKERNQKAEESGELMYEKNV